MFGLHVPLWEKKDIKVLQETYTPYKNFIEESIFSTVSDWDGEDFLCHVENKFSSVIKYLEHYIEMYGDVKYSQIPYLLKHIIELYKVYPSVIRLCLYGRHIEGYRLFSSEIMPNLGMSFSTFRSMTHHPIEHIYDSGKAYRMRVSKKTQLTKQDLFHVPLNKQYLIGNDRFSISGLPCFYLGNSVFCCWKEMNEPDINDCHVAAFDMTCHHFLNLTRIPSEINKSLSIYYDMLNELEYGREETVRMFEYLLDDYLRIWPLIFCCSIRTYYKDSVFKPEYIFPQLLMEWIVEDNRFDGVKFLSTKNGADETFVNYAIPTREFVPPSLYCQEAINKLKLSEPLSISSIRNKETKTGCERIEEELKKLPLDVIE